MKLTVERILQKLGLTNADEVIEFKMSLNSVQDVESLAVCTNLETLDLSGNRFQVKRNIEGLFGAPKLVSLDLSAAPVCKIPQYRQYVIAHAAPTLRVLDKKPISDEERRAAEALFPEAISKRGLGASTSGPIAKKAIDDYDDIFGSPAKPAAPSSSSASNSGSSSSIRKSGASTKIETPAAGSASKKLVNDLFDDESDPFFQSFSSPSIPIISSSVPKNSSLQRNSQTSSPPASQSYGSKPAANKPKTNVSQFLFENDDLFSYDNSPLPSSSPKSTPKSPASLVSTPAPAPVVEEKPVVLEKPEEPVVEAPPVQASVPTPAPAPTPVVSSSEKLESAEKDGLFDSITKGSGQKKVDKLFDDDDDLLFGSSSAPSSSSSPSPKPPSTSQSNVNKLFSADDDDLFSNSPITSSAAPSSSSVSSTEATEPVTKARPSSIFDSDLFDQPSSPSPSSASRPVAASFSNIKDDDESLFGPSTPATALPSAKISLDTFDGPQEIEEESNQPPASSISFLSDDDPLFPPASAESSLSQAIQEASAKETIVSEPPQDVQAPEEPQKEPEPEPVPEPEPLQDPEPQSPSSEPSKEEVKEEIEEEPTPQALPEIVKEEVPSSPSPSSKEEPAPEVVVVIADPVAKATEPTKTSAIPITPLAVASSNVLSSSPSSLSSSSGIAIPSSSSLLSMGPSAPFPSTSPSAPVTLASSSSTASTRTKSAANSTAAAEMIFSFESSPQQRLRPQELTVDPETVRRLCEAEEQNLDLPRLLIDEFRDLEDVEIQATSAYIRKAFVGNQVSSSIQFEITSGLDQFSSSKRKRELLTRLTIDFDDREVLSIQWGPPTKSSSAAPPSKAGAPKQAACCSANCSFSTLMEILRGQTPIALAIVQHKLSVSDMLHTIIFATAFRFSREEYIDLLLSESEEGRRREVDHQQRLKAIEDRLRQELQVRLDEIQKIERERAEKEKAERLLKQQQLALERQQKEEIQRQQLLAAEAEQKRVLEEERVRRELAALEFRKKQKEAYEKMQQQKQLEASSAPAASPRSLSSPVISSTESSDPLSSAPEQKPSTPRSLEERNEGAASKELQRKRDSVQRRARDLELTRRAVEVLVRSLTKVYKPDVGSSVFSSNSNLLIVLDQLLDVETSEGSEGYETKQALKLHIYPAQDKLTAKFSTVPSDMLDELSNDFDSVFVMEDAAALLLLLTDRLTFDPILIHQTLKGNVQTFLNLLSSIDHAKLSEFFLQNNCDISVLSESHSASAASSTAAPSSSSSSSSSSSGGSVEKTESDISISSALSSETGPEPPRSILLNLSFLFVLYAWKGCDWCGNIKVEVTDDSIPNVIISVSPKDVELLEETSEQSYLCSIKASSKMITSFLTGVKSGEELIALKSNDFVITESQADGFRTFFSSFDFSASNFRTYKLENGYDLDSNEIDVPLLQKVEEILNYLPLCFVATTSLMGVTQFNISPPHSSAENSKSICFTVIVEKGPPDDKKTCKVELDWQRPAAAATIQMMQGNFFSIVAGEVDAQTLHINKKIQTDNVAHCMVFFESFSFDLSAFKAYTQSLRLTKDRAAATLAFQKSKRSFSVPSMLSFKESLLELTKKF